MPEPKRYALSLKQPWATLLVHGLKQVEVRAWPTARRGPILIHAARIPDPRPEAWASVPPALKAETELIGGIIGTAVLTDCRTYSCVQEFQDDQELHLNEPTWFRSPVLYGFTFIQPAPLPFRRYPGWMRFFSIDEARS